MPFRMSNFWNKYSFSVLISFAHSLCDSDTSSIFVKFDLLYNLIRFFYKRRKKFVLKVLLIVRLHLRDYSSRNVNSQEENLAALNAGKPELLLYHHLVGKSPAARNTAELQECESRLLTELTRWWIAHYLLCLNLYAPRTINFQTRGCMLRHSMSKITT